MIFAVIKISYSISQMVDCLWHRSNYNWYRLDESINNINSNGITV